MSLEARVRLRRGTFELDVQLAVEAGETVAILGPNGCGKTTLLHALAGLIPIEEGGRFTLDGVVLEDPAQGIAVPTEERPVAVVFQNQLLFPHMSALDNVAFGLRCHGRPRAEARRIARTWLEGMGLGDRPRARPSALSGGQGQRVALARALAVEPRLLLLDEPLAAVDVQGRAELRRDLRRHLGSFGGVRLLVTHDPLEAFALADRVIVLERGHVVQTGTPAAVTARPRSRWVADLAGVNLFHGRADGDRVTLDDGGELVVPNAPGHGKVSPPSTRAPSRSSRPSRRARHERVARTDRRDRHRGTDRTHPREHRATGRRRGDDRGGRRAGLAPGPDVWVTIKATEIALYPG